MTRSFSCCLIAHRVPSQALGVSSGIRSTSTSPETLATRSVIPLSSSTPEIFRQARTAGMCVISPQVTRDGRSDMRQVPCIGSWADPRFEGLREPSTWGVRCYRPAMRACVFSTDTAWARHLAGLQARDLAQTEASFWVPNKTGFQRSLAWRPPRLPSVRWPAASAQRARVPGASRGRSHP